LRWTVGWEDVSGGVGWEGGGKALWPVRNPERGQRHQGGILCQHIRLLGLQCVRRRVVCVHVILCFLIHVDAWQPIDRKRQRVGPRFHFVVHLQRTNIRQRISKGLKRRNQILPPPHHEFPHRPF